MANDRWIVIPNWREFQHYKNRDPNWVKVYTRLLSDDSWLSLTFHVRGVLVGLWLAYARSDGQLRGSTVTLTRQLGGDVGQRVTTRDLDSLNHAGLIEFSASKPLALRYQAASLEAEAEKEKIKAALKGPVGVAAQEPEPVPGWTGLPINLEKEQELQKILSSLTGVDEGAYEALQRAAEGLAFGLCRRVRESIESKPPRTVGVGYAVNALKSERRQAA